jgi:hypothetical protein
MQINVGLIDGRLNVGPVAQINIKMIAFGSLTNYILNVLLFP